MELLERLAKLVQNLTIVLGIAVSCVTLIYTQYERRVDRTIEYKKSFDSNNRKSYTDFTNNWNDFFDKDDRIYDSNNEVKKQAVMEFFGKPENRYSLDDIMDFYDNFWACVHNNSCDVNTGIELFGSQSKDLYESAAFYIHDLRMKSRNGTIGRGLESVAHLKAQGLLARLFPEL